MESILLGPILAALPPLPQFHADWSVYMLLCDNGAYYCGISNRPLLRWRAHCSGKGAKYTRMHTPVLMRLVCVGINKAAAARCEFRLKRLKVAEKSALWQLLPDFQTRI